jgi:hypothetical protein
MDRSTIYQERKKDIDCFCCSSAKAAVKMRVEAVIVSDQTTALNETAALDKASLKTGAIQMCVKAVIVSHEATSNNATSYDAASETSSVQVRVKAIVVSNKAASNNAPSNDATRETSSVQVGVKAIVVSNKAASHNTAVSTNAVCPISSTTNTVCPNMRTRIVAVNASMSSMLVIQSRERIR